MYFAPFVVLNLFYYELLLKRDTKIYVNPPEADKSA